MNDIDFLEQISKKYQDALELNADNFPSGTCYLAGYCLTKYFNKINFKARSVTGSVALIDKNEKYIIYGGNFNLKKKEIVGLYHTWCEVTINGQIYIVDPSLKYNLIFLKKNLKIKLSPKIPPILITTDKETYYWKYIEDNKLINYSDSFLKRAPKQLINAIISSLAL
jgi:hypothetical protein